MRFAFIGFPSALIAGWLCYVMISEGIWILGVPFLIGGLVCMFFFGREVAHAHQDYRQVSAPPLPPSL